jgi:DNA (cytosine-5)-methyltransferase 1
MSVRPTVVSLFSGAGGLDVGLERAGWETVLATDLDPAAVTTLAASQSAHIPVAGRPDRHYLDDARLLEADVCELQRSDVVPSGARSSWRPSLLAGGPPCQPWSSSGLQKGFRDARGLLISQMIRLTDELRPRFVLMENVRGLLTAVGPRGLHGEAIEMIQKEWENLGYAISWALMNAADYGAAQRRVRLLMIGTADHELPPFPLPTHDKAGASAPPWVGLGEVLAARPRPAAEDVIQPSGQREAQLRALRPGTGIKTGGTIEHQRPGGHWGYRQDSFLADLSLPSRTIRAASTPDWVRLPRQSMRRLTWSECAALQGFPSAWEFQGTRDTRFRLIGNAVQTDVAFAVGKVLLDALRRGPASAPPESTDWPPYFNRRIRGAAADHRANAASRKRHRVVKVS